MSASQKPLVQVHQLAKSYGFHPVFKDVSFLLRESEKAALVGPNGVGKTTLLKILAGRVEKSQGSIAQYRDSLRISYHPQEPTFPSALSVRRVLEKAADELGLVRADLDEALSRFRFTPPDAERPTSQLSGGQKTRLSLMIRWLSRPDLLLLDEPTNHLDEDGLVWLEEFVRSFDGAVLVVSHDRYFLDRVAERVIELGPQGAREYAGNYTAYRNAKEAAFRSRMAEYVAQERRIRRLEEAIERQMRWFEKSHRDAGKNTEVRGADVFYKARAKKLAKNAKAKISRLEAMKERAVEKPKRERSLKGASFEGETAGRRLILAENLSKAFDKRLFQDARFSVLKGDKVGIVGPNGSGKTTLLRMVCGEETPTSGRLWTSPALRVGLLDQEIQRLDPQRNVLDEVLSLFPQRTREHMTRVRTLLHSFLFDEDDLTKPTSVLSTGERKRVALLKLTLSEFNLLILDEPTDHLDVDAREKLEEALQAYQGAVLIASHDRYLLRKVCTKVLAIENQTIVEYLGGYDYYTEKSRERDASPTPAASDTLSPAEKLLLETKLAELGSALARMDKEDEGYGELEAEYEAIARRLNACTN